MTTALIAEARRQTYIAWLNANNAQRPFSPYLAAFLLQWSLVT